MLPLSWLLLLISTCYTNADDATWSISFVTLQDPSDRDLHCCGVSYTNFGNLNLNCTVSCFGPWWGYVKDEIDVCEVVEWNQTQRTYSLITGPDYEPTWPVSDACTFYSKVTLWPPVKANENQAYVGVYMDDFDVGCPLGLGLSTLKDGLACNVTYPPSTS